ncbi:MAG: hypothetical protein A2Y91_03430 [Chloroflexi bacterium RBG_13_54_8]|nr:MAG: hypothetical protein A2Y91_03430 [Chloroflexi bacterium RBG_13_54_8]
MSVGDKQIWVFAQPAISDDSVNTIWSFGQSDVVRDATAGVAAGWLGSIVYGSQEVANPASIMGVLAANIQSVKGVLSA